MSGQKELWIILHDEEYNTIWDKFQEEFQFQPQYGKYDKPTFVFNMPVDVYDIEDSPIYNDDEDLNDIIRNGFILAMDDDDFMYAFDYNHTSYRYNPRVNAVIGYPVWISDERYKPHGGYNAYFPEFYPDGDYYFFIAKDFRWGI
jgi:hypothetical protein